MAYMNHGYDPKEEEEIKERTDTKWINTDDTIDDINDQLKAELKYLLDDIEKRKDIEINLIDIELHNIIEKLYKRKEVLKKAIENYYKIKKSNLNELLIKINNLNIKNEYDNINIFKNFLNNYESIINYGPRFIKSNSIDIGRILITNDRFNGLDCQFTLDGYVQDICCSKTSFYTITKELLNQKFLYRITRKNHWNGNNEVIMFWSENDENFNRILEDNCLYLCKISNKNHKTDLISIQEGSNSDEQEEILEDHELSTYKEFVKKNFNILKIDSTIDGVIYLLRIKNNLIFLLKNDRKTIEIRELHDVKKLRTIFNLNKEIFDMNFYKTSYLLLLLANDTILKFKIDAEATTENITRDYKVFEKNHHGDEKFSFQRNIVNSLCHGEMILNKNNEYIYLINPNNYSYKIYPFCKIFPNCKLYDYHLTKKGVIFYTINDFNVLIVKHYRDIL